MIEHARLAGDEQRDGDAWTLGTGRLRGVATDPGTGRDLAL